MGLRSALVRYQERKADRFEAVHGVPHPAKRWPLAGMQTRSTLLASRSTYIDYLGDIGPRQFNEVYEGQAWVYAVVNKIAIAASSLPFKSYGRSVVGARDRLPFEHPLSSLLANPYDYGDSMGLVGAICRDV